MLPLTPFSVPQTSSGSIDSSGVGGAGLSGETDGAPTQSSAEAALAFKTQLSAAMGEGELPPPVSQSNKEVVSPKPSEPTGNHLPPDGTPLPQNLDDVGLDPIPKFSVAQAALPVLGQKSPTGAQLSPGFSEPSDVAVPADLAVRFRQSAEQTSPEQGADSLETPPQFVAPQAPPPISTTPRSQNGVGGEQVDKGGRAPAEPKVVNEFANSLEASGPAAAPKTDTSPDSEQSEIRKNEGEGAARSDRLGTTEPPAPTFIQPLASIAASARDRRDSSNLETAPGAKASNLIAKPQAFNSQKLGAGLALEPTLTTELNEDALPSPKTSPAALVSATSSAPNMQSAPTVALPAAAPGTPPALSSPNSPAVVGAPNASPPVLVERLVEQIADAREAGRTVRPELTLRHGEFGQVGLRIDAGSSTNVGEWRATLMARDPGFVPAVQAALGERISAASESGLSNNGAFSQRGNENGPPSSGSNPSGQSGSQSSATNGGGEQRYGSSTGEGQGPAKPYSGEEVVSGSSTAAADSLDTDTSSAADGASGTQGALFA